MGVGLIALGIVVLIVGSIATGVEKDTPGKKLWIVWLVSTIVLCSVFITGGSYLNQVYRVTEMEAFQSHTLSVYEMTIDETRGLISVDASSATLVDGSIEKIEIASDVASRIIELRDKVESYNRDLAYIGRMDNIPIIGFIYPNVDHLDYIQISR